MILNPKVEMMSSSLKEGLVWERLQKNLKWAYEKSHFYREKYNKANISLSNIKSLSDIKKLPLTTFEELKNTSSFDLLTGPINNTMRLHKTLSGLYRGYTMDDMTRNIDIAIRPLAVNDINKTDTVVLCGEYSSQSLLDLHYGAEALGATVIPCKDAKVAKEVIDIFRANVLIATACDLKQIVETCDDVNALPSKIITLVDDLHLASVEQLESKLNRVLPRIYISKTLGITGLIFTCEEHTHHLQDDYFYPEIVEDYLILTALTFEAMPIIRLHTGKKAKLLSDFQCKCGRTFISVDF